ncbi:MAG TPA: sugar phosphate isomerase/epimerase family protein [Pirellulaceae bacterium]|nr:sugar phosphate isomerase/epimerase family protein [Pirellulaceae bacterium]
MNLPIGNELTVVGKTAKKQDDPSSFLFERKSESMINDLNRRNFLGASSVAMCGALVGDSRASNSRSSESNSVGRLSTMNRVGVSGREDVQLSGRVFKTLKIGMVHVEGSLVDKFKAAKDAGFEGIEMDAPGPYSVQQTLEAIAESGLPVDGTVNSTHWSIRHTDPKPEVRNQARESLDTALQYTRDVGGHSVLLVAGHGQDGSEEEIWQRALENIRLSLPLAARLGVQIVIENVWNHFMYEHAGDHHQTAEKYVRFVDELNSPWVGMQFDIGNHWKYGSMGDWIRQLGRRVYKLDIKGFSRAENKFTRISQGDIDYADVRRALLEINFYGWAAAEVGGGDLLELTKISHEMDEAFGIQ